ncbi:MAG: Uma2 family endonuclease [Spirochaetia bacterium]|nr:Uma2 family endonuclease [Spirochaetia bacterium]
MGLPLKKSDQKYTYKEYCSWPEDERWELIDGVAYNMSPAPTSRHQLISGRLFSALFNFLAKKSCGVFSAPFDVMLPVFPLDNEDKINTVVQPDLSVICDTSKIIDSGCLGAPDLIVEILSPSTSKKDLSEKFYLYERVGVKEYWIVDPGNKYIRVFHLISEGDNSGKYDDGTLIPPADWREKNTKAESDVLKGFFVDIKELFESV